MDTTMKIYSKFGIIENGDTNKMNEGKKRWPGSHKTLIGNVKDHSPYHLLPKL